MTDDYVYHPTAQEIEAMKKDEEQIAKTWAYDYDEGSIYRGSERIFGETDDVRDNDHARELADLSLQVVRAMNAANGEKFYSAVDMSLKYVEGYREGHDAGWKSATAHAGAPARPDIIERLTYHQHERDDMTLDDVLTYLATGWKTIPGRSERQLILQLCGMLAASNGDAR